MQAMISSNPALGLTVSLFSLTMLFLGVFHAYWRAESRASRPGGGHRSRMRLPRTAVPIPIRVSVRSRRGR